MANRPAWQQRDEERIRDLEAARAPWIGAAIAVLLAGACAAVMVLA